jgi:DNA-binding CsgD family transcriptional regulator
MKVRFRESVESALREYRDSNSPFSLANINLLITSLNKFESCGIDAFGYRLIDKQGKSAVFSTSNNWHNISKDKVFLQNMREHMNLEIPYVKLNRLEFITRSKDKDNTPFLEKLGENGMNNSVINFKFHKNKIELFYFIPPKDKPEFRDVILNNRQYLNHLIKEMLPALLAVSKSKKFQHQKIQLLEENVIKQIWQNQLISQTNMQSIYKKINYGEKEILLSPREIECLILLKLGWGNKSIAKQLSLSEFTVKDYISNLKSKFCVLCRDNLIEIAHSNEMKYLNLLVQNI